MDDSVRLQMIQGTFLYLIRVICLAIWTHLNFLFLMAGVTWIYILVLPASWFADLPTSLIFLQSVVVVYSPSPCPVSPVVCRGFVEELVDYWQGQQSEIPRNAAAAVFLTQRKKIQNKMIIQSNKLNVQQTLRCLAMQ